MGRGHHPVLRHEDGPAPVADGADDGILQLYGDLAGDSCKLACLMTQFVTNNKLIVVFCRSIYDIYSDIISVGKPEEYFSTLPSYFIIYVV